jgi:hypothetical protein
VVSSCVHLLGVAVAVLPNWGCVRLSGGRLLRFGSPGP